MNIYTNKAYDDAMWEQAQKEREKFPNRAEEQKLRNKIQTKVNNMGLSELRNLKKYLKDK